ncbi:unnamed protein product [Schistosoma curassoni]|uniref:Secreted protein n=1 Tax=Schistosoma curassoni TaxID=6186 RepID=A0A183K7D4_9TREM|nr:unnamed protein product [Schistosoma curassoni]
MMNGFKKRGLAISGLLTSLGSDLPALLTAVTRNSYSSPSFRSTLAAGSETSFTVSHLFLLFALASRIYFNTGAPLSRLGGSHFNFA